MDSFFRFIEDPILNALGTDSGLIEIYSETIKNYNYDDCKAHPTWFEPIEWLEMQAKKHLSTYLQITQEIACTLNFATQA